MRHVVRLLVTAAIAYLAPACGGSPAGPARAQGPAPTATLTPVADSAEWPASTPGAEGFDAVRLGDLALRIRRGDHGTINSLLIARNGRLIVEEYFGAWRADQAHTQQSVSKSVTSVIAGIAIDRGHLRASDRVTTFFPAYAPIANLDARKEAMTVGDLLTMRSGLDWSESVYPGSPLQRLNDCRCDWIRFVLDWPMREAPGTRWEYVSGGTILAGAVIAGAVGSRLDLFAHEQLFSPLDAEGAYWGYGLPDRLPHTGGGLYMRPRDMAKVGALVADGGRWRGRQIVSAEWIELSTTPIARAVRSWGGRAFDYGYGWWSFELGGERVIAASGARGEWIFAVPAASLVVSVTSENADGRWIAPVQFFQSHIMPALTR